MTATAAVGLSRVDVPDETSWHVGLAAYTHTGRNAVDAAVRVPAGADVAIDIETPSTTDSFTIKCVTAAWNADGRTHAVLLDPLRSPRDAEAVRTIAARAGWLILHNCFAGDTEVITRDGVRRFEDMAGETVEVWADNGWRKAQARCYGAAPVRTVRVVPARYRTNIAHEFRATGNHRWPLTDGRLVYTDDLRPGDRIMAARVTPEIDHNSDAFKHGLIFADGALTSYQPVAEGVWGYQLRLCGAKAQWVHLFDHVTYPPSAGGDPVVTGRLPFNPKALPEGADATYLANFIEGWQLLDGTDYGRNRQVSTTSSDAADWLMLHAAAGGWYATGRSKHVTKVGFKPGSVSHIVTLSRSSGSKPVEWRVTDISEPGEPVPVYCVEVPDIERFTLAQGVYTGNSPFDIPGLVTAGLLRLDDIDKVMDTLLLARAAWPDTLDRKGLEALAARVLGMDALADALRMAQKASGLTSAEKWFRDGDIHMPTYRNGAMADTVVTLRLAHPLFEAAVDRQLDHPFARYGHTARETAAAMILKLLRANRVLLRRAARGMEVDLEYLDRYVETVERDRERATRTLSEAGLRPGVGLDVVTYLDARGELPPRWPRTPTGRLKSDKTALEKLPDHPLATAHRTLAHTTKVLGYMDKVAGRSRVTGRLHPQFHVLGASATGRMCLPVTHSLVTTRGIVAPDDIRVGDLTLDKSGQWTPVTAVHRYDDAEIHIRRWRNFTMECTPEHRWVTLVDGGRERVEAVTGVRRRVRLRVPGPGFDTTARTLRPSFAALVGLLVSDGRCVVNGREMRAYVYQTGGGFYDTMRAAIPNDALMYDRVTAETRRGPHHEMRIRARWLRPLLEEAGLRVETTLARCEGLAAWVARLPLREVEDFLRAVYLSDGDTSNPDQRRITCEHPETQRAVQLAAYRLGYRAYVRYDPPSEWGTKPRAYIRLTDQDVWVRDTPVETTRGAVWCVTTDSGTFTAWNGQPYLTGNSASEPELQQFPEEARPIILCDRDASGLHSIDWSSIEPALLGWMAQDWDFITPFERGADIYEPIQVAAGLPMTKEGRKVAKVIVLAGMYGQSQASLAASLGCSTDRAAELQRQMRRAMPKASRYMGLIKQVAEQHGLALTVSGRVLPIPVMQGRIAVHKAVNFSIQGSCADLIYDAIVAADEAGVGDAIMLPMHDEIVCSSEAADVIQTIMSTPPPELVARAGGRVPVIRTDSQAIGRSWIAC